MGLRDREYMKKQPSDDDYRRYDKEVFDEEYGDVAAKQKATIRKVAIAFLLFLLLALIAVVVVSFV